jgi:hypothetical protein
LEDDNPIFRQPYKLNEVERALVQVQTVELLDVGLVELFKGEYASTIMMLVKNDIFGNWIERCMCGDFHLVNKRTYSNKYVMPLLEEIFNALG